MTITIEERKAILTVLMIGQSYGYGNLISHLQTEWAKRLMSEGLPEKDARKAAGGPGYPFQMQEDLLKHGYWDETGKRYRRRKV